MKLHELITKISGKKTKRVGRGIGSGLGKTAGRGTKGQNSRSGGGVRPGFEGGQTPLIRRIPKLKGFKSIHPNARIVSLADLNKLAAGSKINEEALTKAGLIKKGEFYKILNTGDLEKSLVLDSDNISKGAKEAIEKAGQKSKGSEKA